MTKLIGGIETSYQQMGQGQSVVLLHGWGCDWQIWHPIISRFDARYQLIIPDLPAFGQSHVPQQVWSSQGYVAWLATFIKTTVPVGKPYILIGHSFGGKIATLFAAQHRDPQLQKLVVVDASGLPDPLTGQQQFKQLLIKSIPGPLKNLISPERRAAWLKKVGIASDHALANPQQRAILRQIVRENIADQLVGIQAPTLLIWGENDPDTPPHQGRQFAKLISDSKLIVMPEVGHFPFIDDPTTFMQHLQEFITS